MTDVWDWKITISRDSGAGVNSSDVCDSSTSPSSSRSAQANEPRPLRFNFLTLSRNDLIHKHRIRSTSIDTMSRCGWDFLLGKRVPHWICEKKSMAQERPTVETYVDGRTPIELITDVRNLRRGDHCVIVLNVFRTINPTLDYVHSWLSGYGYFKMFHHFLVLDDVVDIDENGVPRNEDGIAVEILEYSNTASQFLDEAAERGFIASLLDKAKCRRVALIDYGDNKYFYRFNDEVIDEHQDTKRRDLVIQRALEFLRSQPKYHVISHNCEHATNRITMKHDKKSDLVSYVFRNTWRHCIHYVLVFAMWILNEFTLLGSHLESFSTSIHIFLMLREMLRYYPISFRSSSASIVSRIIVVSSIVLAGTEYLVQDRGPSFLVRGFAIANLYWFSDTIVFNSLVNAYAVLVFMCRYLWPKIDV
jgi:hypothetical protein